MLADARKTAQVKSAGRALDLLVDLSSAPGGVIFADLARRLQLPKSSLHALLGVMTERGFVDFDPRRRVYSLGIRAWEVGQAYLHHRDLVREALPLMERVVGEINETVQLATLDGIENVYLAKVDCSHPIRLQSEVGKRLHAHATGLGKALLAFLPNDDFQTRFREANLPTFLPNTIGKRDDLVAAIELIRQRGFATDDQEYTPGLRCVAVPIFGLDGDVPAAISASIPLMRAEDDRLECALRAIAAASIDISFRLGRTAPDPRLAALTEWRGTIFGN